MTARTPKGEQTRAAIFSAALALFRIHGYEATTMRAIAQRAGVSVGSSYHYFPTKEHFVLQLYRRLHDEHRAASAPVLARERSLGGRLRGTVRALVMTVEPLHDVAGSLFNAVVNPESPLSPFSPASGPVRDGLIELYAEVVAGSDAKVPADLAAELPRLLWLYQMGILYFWVIDRSPGRLRTLEVIDETSDLVVQLIQLANLPVLRRSRHRALALVRSVVEDAAAASAAAGSQVVQPVGP